MHPDSFYDSNGKIYGVEGWREGRVFVGVDGSLTSLRALREAAVQARHRNGELHVVHVRQRERPGPVPLVEFFGPAPIAAQDPTPAHRADAAARNLIAECVRDAFGAVPADLDIRQTVLVGVPKTELAALGRRDDDLLVIGTNGGRRRHHLRRRSVSRYCATHSHCPVLVTPCNELARTLRRRAASHPLPRDPWKDFDALDRRETRLTN